MSETRRSLVAFASLFVVSLAGAATVDVGFAEGDITPEVGPGKRPVWLAGYGMGRKAEGVHDPLMVRAVVLRDGDTKLAIACVDLVGLQYDAVERIREKLTDFAHVTVGSSHNHEGPDVIGIWGASPIQRGVDEAYIDRVVETTAKAIRDAEKNLAPATTAFGTAEDESLLNDSRKPQIKDGVLRAVRFTSPTDGQTTGGRTTGLLVQWNCHPEALGSRNKLITADFCATTVAELKATHKCPVVLMTGVVGGLLAPPRNRIKDAAGNELKEGDYRYAEEYGREVARLADKALEKPESFAATPMKFAVRRFAVPVENQLYRAARSVNVLRRPAVEWTGDPKSIGKTIEKLSPEIAMGVVTETACLKLGELTIVNVPGEIYSELVLGKFQEPVEPNVDFPDAPLEESVVQMVGQRKWMLFGLANDEVGYILPKRQWDLKGPYAYGRKEAQYGEINSCGPDVGPILMRMLRECVDEAGD